MFESLRRTVNLENLSWLTIGQKLTGLVAPPHCLLCGGPGQSVDELWGLDLCIHCEAACLPAPPEDLPAGSLFCLFQYRDPVDQLITRLKFHHELACARVLGTLLARAWRRTGRRLPDCLIPLPLHPRRHLERGFCQTTQIARHAAHRLLDRHGGCLPVRTDLLFRARDTRPQRGLGAGDRRINVLGAFEAATAAPPPRHVAVLDDVLTTGHTASAAAAALGAAGIPRVEIWCCARAGSADPSV